jgi:Cation transporter/ATPase, N-terminus
LTEPSPTEDLFAASTDAVFRCLGTSADGLTNDQAHERLTRLGANRLRAKERATGPMLLLRQFTSPIILILIGAAVLSTFLQDVTDAAIILVIVIVIVSGLLGFWQEHRAATAVASLCAVVETKVRVLRAGAEMLVPLEQIVPGAVIPADCRLLRSRRPFFKSRPSKLLALATAATIAATFLVPHLPFAPLLGFEPVPTRFYPIIGLIVIAYVAAAEVTKRVFYRAAEPVTQKQSG